MIDLLETVLGKPLPEADRRRFEDCHTVFDFMKIILGSQVVGYVTDLHDDRASQAAFEDLVYKLLKEQKRRERAVIDEARQVVGDDKPICQDGMGHACWGCAYATGWSNALENVERGIAELGNSPSEALSANRRIITGWAENLGHEITMLEEENGAAQDAP